MVGLVGAAQFIYVAGEILQLPPSRVLSAAALSWRTPQQLLTCNPKVSPQ